MVNRGDYDEDRQRSSREGSSDRERSSREISGGREGSYDRERYDQSRQQDYGQQQGLGQSRQQDYDQSRQQDYARQGSGQSRQQDVDRERYDQSRQQDYGRGSSYDQGRQQDSGRGSSYDQQSQQSYGQSRQQSQAMSGPNTGRGPRGYQRSDERILEEVSEALTQDGQLDPSEIEVSVTNREVMLQGSVNSREDKRRAEELAESASGVEEVHNQLRVKKQGMGERIASTLGS